MPRRFGGKFVLAVNETHENDVTGIVETKGEDVEMCAGWGGGLGLG